MFFSLPKFKDFNKKALAYLEPSQMFKLEHFMIPDPTINQMHGQ